MVAVSYILSAILALSASVSAYPGHFDKRADLPVGTYAPPGPGDARSPCPAFNVMANHGYLPRSGKDITVDQVVKAFSEQLGVEPSFVALMANAAAGSDDGFINSFGVRDEDEDPKSSFDLDDLSKHNRIEHDASLTRPDFPNPQNVVPELVAALASRAADKKTLRIPEVAKYRVDRFELSKKSTPGFTFGPKQQLLAWGESALFIGVLGNKEGEVPLDFFVPFFLNETLPAGFTPKRGKDRLDVARTAELSLRLRTSVGIKG
ncbi:hypothetical protein HDV05_007421 [Chytridiales sp. JEL 0842]|nr:hypothetical protein HDV05_007421 [Chytridiales sp. JEL 0842]